jgi:hypothetical protein
MMSTIKSMGKLFCRTIMGKYRKFDNILIFQCIPKISIVSASFKDIYCALFPALGVYHDTATHYTMYFDNMMNYIYMMNDK